MTVFLSLRRALGWLMLSLALGGGVVPPALADRDSSHFGETDASSFHSHLSAPDHTHDNDPGDTHATDSHGNDYCTDHCCSDACTPALNGAIGPALGGLSFPWLQTARPTPPGPAEGPFIPPRIA